MRVICVITMVVAAALCFGGTGFAQHSLIEPSGDLSGITDYNNLMDALNGALEATANIRCVAGAYLNDGETIQLEDVSGSIKAFEFDFGNGVVFGNIAIPVDSDDTQHEVAVALAEAVNGSSLQIDAVAVHDVSYRLDWVLLTQTVVGPRGNGLRVRETVANSAFIAQQTFEGGCDGHASIVIELAAGEYYVSRTVRVEGFNGIVRGAGMAATILNAGREFQAVGGGFGFAYDPYWEAEGTPMLAGHFMFLFPESITFENLTLRVTDASPCDFVDYYGLGTGLAGFALEIAGSTPEVIPEIVVKDVAVLGAAGDLQGKNLPWGMFVVLGDSVKQNFRGRGNILIENCYVSDSVWRGIVMGSLTDNSSGIITGCTVENSGQGIRVLWADSSHIQIKENTLSDVWLWPIGLFLGVSGVEIFENTVSGGTGNQLLLRESSFVTVRDNTFRDFNGRGAWWSAPVFVRNNNHDLVIKENEFINIQGAPAAILVRGLPTNTYNMIFENDYKKSKLPGWNIRNPNGAGCVLLGTGTYDNYVDEMLFPGGTDLCEQVLDEGTNEIVGWDEECGNY